MKIRGKMFIGLVICLILGAITCGFASANSSNLSDEYDVFVVTKNVTLPGDSYPTATFYFGLKDKSGNIVIPATYSGMKLYKARLSNPTLRLVHIYGYYTPLPNRAQ